MSSNYIGHLHLFCMHTVYIDCGLTLKEANKAIQIDPQNFAFGEHAVFIRPKPFLERLKTILEKKTLKADCRLVEYYDPNIQQHFIEKDLPFRKQNQYSYQREYRICINTRSEGSDPLKLNLGDMSKFCIKIKSSSLTDAEIKFKD